jgi:hypothetical protein
MWVDALEQEMLCAHDPDTTDAERVQGIIESKYTPADLSKNVGRLYTPRQSRKETVTTIYYCYKSLKIYSMNH